MYRLQGDLVYPHSPLLIGLILLCACFTQPLTNQIKISRNLFYRIYKLYPYLSCAPYEQNIRYVNGSCFDHRRGRWIVMCVRHMERTHECIVWLALVSACRTFKICVAYHENVIIEKSTSNVLILLRTYVCIIHEYILYT